MMMWSETAVVFQLLCLLLGPDHAIANQPIPDPPGLPSPHVIPSISNNQPVTLQPLPDFPVFTVSLDQWTILPKPRDESLFPITIKNPVETFQQSSEILESSTVDGINGNGDGIVVDSEITAHNPIKGQKRNALYDSSTSANLNTINGQHIGKEISTTPHGDLNDKSEGEIHQTNIPNVTADNDNDEVIESFLNDDQTSGSESTYSILEQSYSEQQSPSPDANTNNEAEQYIEESSEVTTSTPVESSTEDKIIAGEKEMELSLNKMEIIDEDKSLMHSNASYVNVHTQNESLTQNSTHDQDDEYFSTSELDWSLNSVQENSEKTVSKNSTVVEFSVIVGGSSNDISIPKYSSSFTITSSKEISLPLVKLLTEQVRQSTRDVYMQSQPEHIIGIENAKIIPPKGNISTVNETSTVMLYDDAASEEMEDASYNDHPPDMMNVQIIRHPIPPPPLPCMSRTCIRKCCLQNQTFSLFPPDIGCVARVDTDPEWILPDFHHKSGGEASALSEIEMAYGKLDCRYGEVSPEHKHYILPSGDLYNSYTEVEYSQSSYCLEVVRNGKDKIKMEMISCFEPASPTVYYKIRMTVMPALMFVSIVSLLVLVSCYVLVPEFRDMQGTCRLNHAVCMLVAVSLTFSTHIIPGSIPYNACVVIGLSVHVISIAAFLWLTVLCYDGRRFISMRLAFRTRDKTEDRSFFVRYNVFAWGGATVLGVVSLTLQLLPEDALPPWVIRPHYAKTRCFIHDDTMHLLVYHFSIVGTLFLANVIFLGHTCFMLYQQGVAFKFLARIRENKLPSLLKSRQFSHQDSVFDSSDSCHTKSSSLSSRISSRIPAALLSWRLPKGSKKEMSAQCSDVSSTVSEISTAGRCSLDSISETNEESQGRATTDEQAPEPQLNRQESQPQKQQPKEDPEDDLQSRLNARKKIDKKDCNMRNMRQGKSTNMRGPSYVSDFWQRFQMFVLIALFWTTEVLSFAIPPRELWIFADMLNVLQGFWLFVLFIKFDKNRARVKLALLKIRAKYFRCCIRGTNDFV